MPLLAQDRVFELLCCPRCRQSLAVRDGSLACKNSGCTLNGRRIPSVGGQPAVVDFERSVLVESDLRQREGGSNLHRRSERGLVGALRRISAPPNRVAPRFAEEIARRAASSPSRRLMVVGGGTKGSGAEALYTTPGVDVISFDLYASENTQFIADAHQIPLPDASVTGVWVQAVLEHVLDPNLVVSEIHRVLEPGGRVYSETPFLQHVHEGPWDFARFTDSGHRWLFRNFESLESGVVAGPGTVWVWATEMLARGLTRSVAAGKLSRLLFWWVHLFDRWIPKPFGLDGASCVYFYGLKSSRGLRPLDAVAAYQGAQRAYESGARPASSDR